MPCVGVASWPGIMKCWVLSSRGWLSFKTSAEASKGKCMEWEANHMDDFITSPQSDMFYFLDSVTQETYQEFCGGFCLFGGGW